MPARQGDELHMGMLVLASRGEAFVGKLRPEQAAAALPEPEPATDLPDHYERTWSDGGGAAARGRPATNVLRVLQFNVLAPSLTAGTLGEPAALGLAAGEQQQLPLGGCGVFYRDLSAMVGGGDGGAAHGGASGGGKGAKAKKKRCGWCKQASCPGPAAHRFRCAQSDVEWSRRLPLLLSELLRHDADVLCLQASSCFMNPYPERFRIRVEILATKRHEFKRHRRWCYKLASFRMKGFHT